jgi:hypothetical protein
MINLNEPPKRFGYKLKELSEKVDLKNLTTDEVRYTLIDNIIPGVEKILNYSFANKNVLLEALTHRKFGYGNLEINYEKLEVLGDAILDYIANSNLIKYTMFEKYNIEERKN